MRLLLLLGAGILLVLGIVGSGAFAAGPETCSGTLAAGTHGSVVANGACSVAPLANVTINGDLTLADGAVFNALFSPGSVHVTGNVKVGQGALLGLGYGAKTIVVDGNIQASKPLSVYLGGATVHGNVVSNGGGTAARFYNFPIKDNTIDGNLTIHGWQGGWWGAVANTVGGNVDVANNGSVVHPTDDAACMASGTFPNGCPATPGADPDSSEVQSRGTINPQHISGNLICHKNAPAAQINPGDGGAANIVDGNKIGECAGL